MRDLAVRRTLAHKSERPPRPHFKLLGRRKEGKGRESTESDSETLSCSWRKKTAVVGSSFVRYGDSNGLGTNMAVRGTTCLLVAVTACVLLAFIVSVQAKDKEVKELQIGVKFKPKKCEVKAHKGDKVSVHYRGTLVDGTEFDSSYGRAPFDFKLGSGAVIKGWDQGLLGMCLGEKRKLKIPSKLGYGDSGSPPKIPGGATLVFDTELVGVNGKKTSSGSDEL